MNLRSEMLADARLIMSDGLKRSNPAVALNDKAT